MTAVMNAVKSLVGDSGGTPNIPNHPNVNNTPPPDVPQPTSNPFGPHEMNLKGELGNIWLNQVRNLMQVDAMGAAIGNGINPNVVQPYQPKPEPNTERESRSKETHKETGVLKGGLLALAGVTLPCVAMWMAGVFDRPEPSTPETPKPEVIHKTTPGKTIKEKVKIESKVRPPGN